jgi:hypothetical protein
VLQLHNEWFEKVRFFKQTPKEEKDRFIIAIAFALKLQLFARGDQIIRLGELCDQMYIVYKGLAALLGRVLGVGKVLGEDMILCLHHKEWRRHYSAKALTFAQLHMLCNKGLTNMLDKEVGRECIAHDPCYTYSKEVGRECIAHENYLQQTRRVLFPYALCVSCFFIPGPSCHSKDAT